MASSSAPAKKVSKPPVIKQTKASSLRLLKANPLLKVNENARKLLGISDAYKSVIYPEDEHPLNSTASNMNRQQPSTSISSTKQENRTFAKSFNGKNLSKNSSTRNNLVHASVDKQRSENVAHKTNDKPNVRNNRFNGVVKKSNTTVNKKETINSNQNISIKDGHFKAPIEPNRISLSTAHRLNLKNLPKNHRRSVSAEKFDSKKHLNLTNTQQQLTQSMEDVSKQFENAEVATTPQANRRSIYSITTARKNVRYSTIVRSLNPTDLRSKLSDWLEKNKKSLGSFHHLRCFGIELKDDIKDDENKENVEEEVDLNKSESYENLCIGKRRSNEDNFTVPDKEDDVNYDLIARQALQDLYMLIQEGYSRTHCSAWLDMIHKKCGNVEEEPCYWECRAALEQSEENIVNAMECYRTAIVKGAEIQSIDQSLEHLLEKFSLLNIHSNVDNSKDLHKEARDFFKSTIIKFAVQERELKKKNYGNKSLYVTPVRRSNRLSSRVQTPGVCSSMRQIESNNVQFRNNHFLQVRFNN